MHQLKRIAKGKWLLELFCIEIQAELNALQNHCGVGDFGRCQQCRSANSDKSGQNLFFTRFHPDQAEAALIETR